MKRYIRNTVVATGVSLALTSCRPYETIPEQTPIPVSFDCAQNAPEGPLPEKAPDAINVLGTAILACYNRMPANQKDVGKPANMLTVNTRTKDGSLLTFSAQPGQQPDDMGLLNRVRVTVSPPGTDDSTIEDINMYRLGDNTWQVHEENKSAPTTVLTDIVREEPDKLIHVNTSNPALIGNADPVDQTFANQAQLAVTQRANEIMAVGTGDFISQYIDASLMPH